jgi:hypothetical protein
VSNAAAVLQGRGARSSETSITTRNGARRHSSVDCDLKGVALFQVSEYKVHGTGTCGLLPEHCT